MRRLQFLDEENLKHAIGFHLFGELDALTKAIKHRVTTHEAEYVAAGRLLETLMIAKFKDKVFPFRALGAKAGLSQLDRENTKPPEA